MFDQQSLDEFYDLANKADEDIKLNASLERLYKHPDFITVIAKGYLSDLALKLVKDKGASTCTGIEEINVDKDILGIGKLQHYLDTIRANADIATKTKEDAHNAIQELTKGDE